MRFLGQRRNDEASIRPHAQWAPPSVVEPPGDLQPDHHFVLDGLRLRWRLKGELVPSKMDRLGSFARLRPQRRGHVGRCIPAPDDLRLRTPRFLEVACGTQNGRAQASAEKQTFEPQARALRPGVNIFSVRADEKPLTRGAG
jgi:hypothetical protein